MKPRSVEGEARRVEALRAALSRPETRAKQAEAARRRYQRPEEREAAARRTKLQMADPEQRSRNKMHLDSMNKARRGQPGRALGMSREPVYKVWVAMCQRCSNENGPSARIYMDRGIHVTPEWLGPGGFARFYEHMGPRPSRNHSIDRINNAGHYEPGNVRWATAKEQSHNSRRVRMIMLCGETHPAAEWARRIGLTVPALIGRIERGWSEEDVLSPPLLRGRRVSMLARQL